MSELNVVITNEGGFYLRTLVPPSRTRCTSCDISVCTMETLAICNSLPDDGARYCFKWAGPAESKETTVYLEFEGSVYKLKRLGANGGLHCNSCGAMRDYFCTQYCDSKGQQALCNVLGKHLGYPYANLLKIKDRSERWES